MVELLAKVGEIFDALTADGAEEVQLVITPENCNSALSLKWKMKVGNRVYDIGHVLSREILIDSYAPDFIEQTVMYEAMTRLQMAMIDGKTKEEA